MDWILGLLFSKKVEGHQKRRSTQKCLPPEKQKLPYGSSCFVVESNYAFFFFATFFVAFFATFFAAFFFAAIVLEIRSF